MPWTFSGSTLKRDSAEDVEARPRQKVGVLKEIESFEVCLFRVSLSLCFVKSTILAILGLGCEDLMK